MNGCKGKIFSDECPLSKLMNIKNQNFYLLSAALSLLVLLAQGQAGANKEQADANNLTGSKKIKESSFEEFKKRLLDAVSKRDKQFIVNILSANVLTAIGGEKGKEAFLKDWQELSPESPFWQRFSRVLQHGAQYDEGTNEFHAPNIEFADSHSELPQGIIWNRDAVLYLKSEDISNASKAIPAPYLQQVTMLEPNNPEPLRRAFAKIKTKSGRSFFVSASDLYSAYDEFAVFKKEDNRWQLTWFGYASL